VSIEVTHVVDFMGENYVQARCRRREACGHGDWTEVGRNTTHTGYQLRHALDLQAQAISSWLARRRLRADEQHQ